MRRVTVLALLVASIACHREPDVVAELAAYLPENSPIVAGLDVDRLRNTPLYNKLPESFREASYVLAAYSPPNLVTASRVKGRIVATTPKTNAPPDLIQHRAATPIWLVVRGDTPLPLTGNPANVNRLLSQTVYTRIMAQIADRIALDAEGVCATPADAEHLEQNLRAIATLAKLPLNVRREGATVYVAASFPLETISGLF